MRRVAWLLRILCMAAALSTAHAQAVDPALKPLAFLSGVWIGDSKEGMQEEYWSAPIGSSMVGTFRVVQDTGAVFYEFWTIETDSGKAFFKMKHFNRGLIGWEEKADAVLLSVKETKPQSVLFAKADGSLSLLYERAGDELKCTVRHLKHGQTEEEIFHLHRSRSAGKDASLPN